MTISVNGASRRVAEELTVIDLLENENVESPDMVAVQINGTILEKSAFAVSRLADGDAVEFLYFMGGGA